mmetsp:Transcript_27954/g.83777  ORF Transcript_27954/g.83777 Transcript_27954/m.83777 type:complete len:282 (-) Transcript_27954:505-1350(-)
MGKAQEEEPCRARAVLGGFVASTIGRSLIAVAVVAGAAKIRSIGAPEQRHKKILPISKPGDGWVGKLSRSQLAQLDAGKKVLLSRRLGGDSGGRGTAVCDVAAPPDCVMKAVVGFDRYAGRLAQCSYSSVYGRSKNVMQRTETIKVHMKLAGGVKTFNCYYDHTYRPDKNLVTWTLDPDEKSDFVDVQGQWVVFKHPTKKGWSRVWYSAEVALPPWLPRLVVVQLCKTSGTKALSFVTKEALLHAEKLKPRWGRGGGLKGGALQKLRPPRAALARPVALKR